MKIPLLCRLGYHRFGSWQKEEIEDGTETSFRSPQRRTFRVRTCSACGLGHRDYSPQIGMLVTPPGPA